MKNEKEKILKSPIEAAQTCKAEAKGNQLYQLEYGFFIWETEQKKRGQLDTI